MYYAYRLDNVLSGKMYFGHTNVNPKDFTFEQLKQLAQGNKDLRHLFNSMKKYGEKAFKVSVLNCYEEKEEAIKFVVNKIVMCNTDSPAHGFNNNSAELIPYDTFAMEKDNDTMEEKTTIAISKEDNSPQLLDTIKAATETLIILRDCVKARDIQKFFDGYVYFNTLIPITGVYTHFSLAIDGMIGTLFEICRDSLAVYIKEHIEVRY